MKLHASRLLASRLLMLGLSVLSMALPTYAAELKIDLGHGVVIHHSETLLQRQDLRTIRIPADVSFHRTMSYQAVPLTDLLPGLGATDHLQFVGTDGFSAEIPAALLLQSRGSEAWLAIENPLHPWPALPAQHGRAGPFYIVWTKPQLAKVSPEQWPYQLASIR